jgi:hypothetical protein
VFASTIASICNSFVGIRLRFSLFHNAAHNFLHFCAIVTPFHKHSDWMEIVTWPRCVFSNLSLCGDERRLFESFLGRIYFILKNRAGDTKLKGIRLILKSVCCHHQERVLQDLLHEGYTTHCDSLPCAQHQRCGACQTYASYLKLTC